MKGGESMRRLIFLQSLILTYLVVAPLVFAQSADISRIQTFIQSVIQILVTLAGLLSAGFFVWGGIGYITSSGNPESLERSKRTIFYSAIGLSVALGAFVISTVVTQLATAAFGK